MDWPKAEVAEKRNVALFGRNPVFRLDPIGNSFVRGHLMPVPDC
jgi:hypothetical protein